MSIWAPPASLLDLIANTPSYQLSSSHLVYLSVCLSLMSKVLQASHSWALSPSSLKSHLTLSAWHWPLLLWFSCYSQSPSHLELGSSGLILSLGLGATIGVQGGREARLVCCQTTPLPGFSLLHFRINVHWCRSSLKQCSHLLGHDKGLKFTAGKSKECWLPSKACGQWKAAPIPTSLSIFITDLVGGTWTMYFIIFPFNFIFF
jgi:hypothetical protein